MEMQILQVLEFDVTTPSALRFLQRYVKLSAISTDAQKVLFFAQYL